MTSVVINSIKVSKVGDVDVWACTCSATLSAKKGDVLVEADATNMLVENINAVAPTDLDMLDTPATGDEDFDGARYSYTPALGGIMYINRMSPMPKCVLDLNKSNINGWYQVQSV